MQKLKVDWDTTRDVLRAGTREDSVSVRTIAVDVARRQDTSADDPQVIEAILKAADDLVRNGFIDAPYPFEKDSEVRGIKPLGQELFEWMEDEHKWNRLRPALEEALQSGLGADHQYLSANALDAAMRGIGVR